MVFHAATSLNHRQLGAPHKGKNGGVGPKSFNCGQACPSLAGGAQMVASSTARRQTKRGSPGVGVGDDFCTVTKPTAAASDRVTAGATLPCQKQRPGGRLRAITTSTVFLTISRSTGLRDQRLYYRRSAFSERL